MGVAVRLVFDGTGRVGIMTRPTNIDAPVLRAQLAKANRLIAAGAVTIHGDATVATVTGDHDTYMVTARRVGTGWAMRCTCPFIGPDCSHNLAVRKVLTDPPAEPADPFEGLT